MQAILSQPCQWAGKYNSSWSHFKIFRFEGRCLILDSGIREHW